MQPHPAPFSAPILVVVRELMQGERRARVLDPFCGTGRVLSALPDNASATLIDIEPKFIQEGLLKFGNDAARKMFIERPVEMYDHVQLDLPRGITSNWYACDSRIHLRQRRGKTYTHIITSPTYGNRFTDGYRSKPGTRCRSYAQSIGGPLQEGNTGSMKFGTLQYDEINEEVMAASIKRLVEGGKIIINVSDFLRTETRGGEPVRQPVVYYWIDLMHRLGVQMLSMQPVYTRRFKEGENRHRVEFESVITFQKVD